MKTLYRLAISAKNLLQPQKNSPLWKQRAYIPPIPTSETNTLKFDPTLRAHPHRVQTLQKWSAKVQSVAPNALLPSKRTSFKQQSVAPKSAVDLIAEGLEEGSVGHAKAIGRTRIRRGQTQARLGVRSGGIVSVGESEETTTSQTAQEGDAEVFDDTDFYQEILRDVIQAKSGSTSHSILYFFLGT